MNMEQNPTSDAPVAVQELWQPFETDTVEVVQRLRSALAEIVAGAPGHVVKPTDLQRVLHVDMNVCCKILKVVSASGPLLAGLYMPGIQALRSFLKAARKAGVRASVVEVATQAADEFDSLVSTHADDRATFDSMISSLLGAEEAAQVTFQHRRATFRGQRHLFGLQASVQFKCMLMQPSSQDPRLLDLATLTGFVSLRLLRPATTPIVLSPAYTTNDDGSVRTVHREPLHPTTDQAAGIALLPEFCSTPTVKLREVPAAPGRVLGELVGIGVGNTAAVTCVEGHVGRAAVPRYREPGNRVGGHLSEVRVPCETMLLDLLVREDTCGPLTPTVHTCENHLAGVRTPGDSAPWQPLEPLESVMHLGKGPSVLYTPDYPRYPELGRHSFDQLGWDGERFDVYRCRIEYPMLPSTIAIFFELPEEPEG